MRLALILAGVLVLVAPAPAATTAAKVWVASERPLSIRGSGFASADRVTVTATKGKIVLRKTVTAGSGGRFVARWLRALPSGCANTKVTARGTSGRHATSFVVMDDCGPIDPPTR